MLRKGNNELLTQKRKEQLKGTVRSVLLLTCLTMFIILYSKIYEQQLVINELEAKNTQCNNAITMQNELINNMAVTIQDQDKCLQSLSDTNKSYVDELNELRSRAELYDKYEYILVNSYGRTDLTYEQVELGQDLMAEKGYDPDLLFGVIYNESKGIATAKNSSSSASGYGQFLSSTGRWVYEDYLQLGDDYDHSVTPFDGETNIRMMVGYYDYLYNRTGGNTVSMMQSYTGGSYEYASAYLSRIEKVVNATGSSIYDGE